MRKAPTTPHSQATAPQAKDRGGLQGRPRWGFKRHPRQGVNVQSTWSGREVELGTCHCLPYDVHLVHTRVPRIVIADDRESILCGGDPPRGLSDETTSLGAMATATASQLQPFNTSNLDDFCSANDFRRAARVWSHRENCKDGSNRISNSIVKMIPRDDSKLSNSLFPRHWISSSSVVSGGPVTRSKRTHPWMSGVTMLVRWLCSFPASALLAQVGRVVFCPASALLAQVGGSVNTRSSPASRKCTPRQPREHVNQQAASCPRSTSKVCLGGLAVTGLGKECTLTPSIRSESELLDLHVPRGPRPTFQETAEG